MYICTAGCTHNGAPRVVSEKELLAHDDRHLGSRARVIVRMFRDSSPEQQAELFAYLTGVDGAALPTGPRFAAEQEG